MDPLETIARIVVLPAMVALAVALASHRWRHAGALGVAAGSVAGAWALFGRPALLPLDVIHRVGHVVVVALALALVGTRFPGKGKWIARVAAGFAASWLLIGPLVGHRFGTVAAAAVLCASAAAVTLIATAFSEVGRVEDRVSFPVAIVSLAVASLAAGLSGSVVIAQTGGATTAALGGVWLATLRKNRSWLAATALVVAAAMISVVVLGKFYSSMSTLTALALIAMPIAFAAGVRWLTGSRRILWLITTAALVGALAIGSSLAGDDGGSSAGSDDDYGYD